MQATAINKSVNVESVMKAFAAKIDSAGFATWIAPLQMNVCENCLSLVAQNQFTADYIKREYGNVLKNVAADFLLDLDITVCSNSACVKSANDNVICEFVKPVKQAIKNKNGFDSFICSDENMFAVAACKKIASMESPFSQLFIYGPAGSGKSMLLDCICNTTDKNVVKMSGGQFVADFARALRDKTIFSFKDFCRNCDLFIMDDVCALAGKRATSDEFLQLMMDLRAAGKSVVLTANCTPNALNGFDRRIQSLLASGLVVDVVAPNAHVLC